MATQRITFGEWLPDQAGLAGALTLANNVVPQAVGYGPLPAAARLGDGDAGEDLITMHTAKDSSGEVRLFSAGREGVFSVSALGVFTDVSGTTYTTATTDRIRFTQFGKNTIFTNNSEKLQYFNLDSSTAFADLAADAPVAKYITVVRDFVVVANTKESGNIYGSRVRWSGINDDTVWTYSQTTQSDYQDIPDGGNIVGIRGGEFGLILMDNAIVRMSYVGTPFIFQFDNISRGTGCIEENSIAQYQGVTFFLSQDGFYMCDGQSLVSIGSEKVDRHFFETVELANISTMSTAVDPVRKLVIWNYPTTGNKRTLLIYNFKTQRWSSADGSVTYISDASTGSVTLEELDLVSTSIDLLPQSLDSSAYVGGTHFLGGVLGGAIYTFTGLPRDGEIVTGDVDVGSRSVVHLARPQIDGGSANVSISSRVRLDEAIVYSTPVPADAENRVSLRSSGRYHRVKVEPTGNDWKTAVAVDIDIVPQGGR